MTFTCFESVFLIAFIGYCALIVVAHLPNLVRLLRSMTTEQRSPAPEDLSSSSPE